MRVRGSFYYFETVYEIFGAKGFYRYLVDFRVRDSCQRRLRYFGSLMPLVRGCLNNSLIVEQLKVSYI